MIVHGILNIYVQCVVSLDRKLPDSIPFQCASSSLSHHSCHPLWAPKFPQSLAQYGHLRNPSQNFIFQEIKSFHLFPILSWAPVQTTWFPCSSRHGSYWTQAARSPGQRRKLIHCAGINYLNTYWNQIVHFTQARPRGRSHSFNIANFKSKTLILWILSFADWKWDTWSLPPQITNPHGIFVLGLWTSITITSFGIFSSKNLCLISEMLFTTKLTLQKDEDKSESKCVSSNRPVSSPAALMICTTWRELFMAGVAYSTHIDSVVTSIFPLSHYRRVVFRLSCSLSWPSATRLE